MPKKTSTGFNDLSRVKRILVVEDEVLVAMMVEDMLIELGATVVGPAFTVTKAMLLAKNGELDAAVLDVNVRDEHIEPVADVLRDRLVPLVFATGYGHLRVPQAGNSPILDKPYTQDKLQSALIRAMEIS